MREGERLGVLVYAAIDVDRNEILSMRVFPSRNVLATKLFVEDALKYCDGEPTFVVDSAPWLRGAQGARLETRRGVLSVIGA